MSMAVPEARGGLPDVPAVAVEPVALDEVGLPVERFARAGALAIDDALHRLGVDGRERLDRAVGDGLVTGYSIRLDVDVRTMRAAVLVEITRSDGKRELVQRAAAEAALSCW